MHTNLNSNPQGLATICPTQWHSKFIDPSGFVGPMQINEKTNIKFKNLDYSLGKHPKDLCPLFFERILFESATKILRY